MKSVPPRGSGWVSDARDLIKAADPPATREVVLTA